MSVSRQSHAVVFKYALQLLFWLSCVLRHCGACFLSGGAEPGLPPTRSLRGDALVGCGQLRCAIGACLAELGGPPDETSAQRLAATAGTTPACAPSALSERGLVDDVGCPWPLLSPTFWWWVL